MPLKLLLTHKHAPGDTVVLTALFRDVKRAYPDIQIGFHGHAMDVVKHNPYLTHFPLDGDGNPVDKTVRRIRMCYREGLRRQNIETCHFVAEFHRNFKQHTGLTIPITEPYPDLHLTDEERATPIIDGPYWCFLSGGKSDFTAKVWANENWIQLAAELKLRGVPLVQFGGTNKGHWHPEVPGVLNLVGRTNLRDMMRLIYHSQGVICGVTCAMHMAAAFQRPCVVIAGGREAWYWEAYVRENKGLGCPERLRVPHKFLHTIGLLSCCAAHGCWRSKVVPLHDDRSICKMPIIRPGQAVPKCLDMITVPHVVEAVMDYVDNSYPPIRDNVTLPPPVNAPAVEPQLAVNHGLTQANTPVTHVPGNINSDIFDHPTIGGRLTVFVLLYGAQAYHAMHKKCINAIISTIPGGRLDLRIGSNELCGDSVKFVDKLVDEGMVTKHYRHVTNDKKYPVMREMFNDPDCPIETKWLLWFDDDSIADRHQRWCHLLMQQIIAGADNNCHMYGAKYIWTLQTGQANWIKGRPWYRGRPFRTANGRPAANGDKILFAAGGFWALSTEAMRACDIPDAELGHNGGDYTIGEQLYQGGFELKAWNGQKQFVNTSSVPRRGLSERHIGTTPKITHRVVT